MASFHSFHLGDIVKSKALIGAKLQISVETGTPNDFGIFDRFEGNPTAAYTVQERDGYKEWRGRWCETISWDRDTYAPPPDNLDCVHLTEVVASGKGRHGWLFTDKIERIAPTNTSISPEQLAIDEVKIKTEVTARQQKIVTMKHALATEMLSEEKKVEQIAAEVLKTKKQLQELEAALRKAEEELWDRRNARGLEIQREEQACNDLIYQNHHFDYRS